MRLRCLMLLVLFALLLLFCILLHTFAWLLVLLCLGFLGHC